MLGPKADPAPGRPLGGRMEGGSGGAGAGPQFPESHWPQPSSDSVRVASDGSRCDPSQARQVWL